MPDARYKHADELPPLEQAVILKMANGVEFEGCRVWLEDDNGGGWGWATVHEYDPKAPKCWTDGVCWGKNDDGVPSRQPRYWRYK
jgi:hypothetical protein